MQQAASVKATLSSAPTSGDPALIERLIANLLDNAILHNDERGIVEIATGLDAEESYVTVGNTGPVVPTWALERLFEPFSRLDEIRGADASEHHGLGLSIVRSIANAHDARIDATPREGGGLTVTVSFPRSTQ